MNTQTTPDLPKAEAFFYKHAGFGYAPAQETEEQGKLRHAHELANAENAALEHELDFNWTQDVCDSSEWSDEAPAWEQWVCTCRDAQGRILVALGCIDFGRDGAPWGAPYKRVVEAELAVEALEALAAIQSEG
ncbi:hypothetical protein [Cerasicoccus frondis]|uniref:hypothetical protein n=1 Tax=Cerasicoccus frondis TaxID=490090 RepID=UPI0028528801|nr:hypothetical protein [Cerasicoccus frondis]